MNPITSKRISELLETFNTKQKQIASKLIIDKNFTFIDNEKMLIKDNRTNQIYDFVDFVKSKCNCG